MAAPMMAPSAVLPDALPMAPPIAAPVPAPMTAPFWALLMLAQPAVVTRPRIRMAMRIFFTGLSFQNAWFPPERAFLHSEQFVGHE